MAFQGKTSVKEFFETGDKPTQAQFIDLIDSTHVKDDTGVISATVASTGRALRIIGSSREWYFSQDRVTAIASAVDLLRIDNNGQTGLGVYLADVSGGQRLLVWDPGQALPVIPHTGLYPTFAVYGDMLVGDIVALGSNPMTYFVRASANIDETAITTFFCAKNGANDTDGGAQITLTPKNNTNGANVNDGVINIVAYGAGIGSLANSIRFRQRSGANTVRDIGYFDSSGHYTPGASQSFDFGTGGARIRYVYAGRINAEATSDTSAAVGRFIAAVGGYTGTSLVVGNTLGDDAAYNLLDVMSDADADGGGPFYGLRVRGDRNVSMFGAGSYGGGVQVLFVGNAGTAPTSNPTGGGILYAQAGKLMWRGSSGTVTTVAAA